MRILVAEDDLTSRAILTGILKKWGYKVLAVNDGQSAWQALQQPDCPHLVILDWVMPGLDGVEVIRRVRSADFGQPPYIILLTSKSEKGDILSGLEAGANDYIKKPFDNEELNARIKVGQRTVELQTRLFETQQTLERLASYDPLTGILNRRAILEQLSKELSRARREPAKNEYLGIGFFDVDHFKMVNDQYGHRVGDEVLCGLVRLIRDHMRVYDSIGRLGGDEFLIIAPGMEGIKAENIFERITSAINSYRIKTFAGELSVTVSMGVAMADLESGEDMLLHSADAAMYRAKREGGNRVIYTK